MLNLLLDLLTALPEEEIRRDGGAEDGDERRHVSSQRESEPAQELGVTVVGHEDFEAKSEPGDQEEKEDLGDRNDQTHRRGHAPEVRTDVEDICRDH